MALLALEVLVLLLLSFFTSFTKIDTRQYISDIVFTLYPQARNYLQPGEEDVALLQDWLEQVYASGYASLEPQDWSDSPAAAIVKHDPMYVLSPDGLVLAQAPSGGNSLAGRRYTPPNVPRSREILESAFEKVIDPLQLSTVTPSGDYLVAVPVFQESAGTNLVGVMILTVEPPPPVYRTLWPYFLGIVALTGFLLLLAVAPFGALFGLIMSRGLTRRLTALARAADAWSEGDFSLQPQDRSQDEIGALGVRMRHMAERIQGLLQSQRDLALLEERNRLARELHDTVKQQTFATLMQVRAAKNLLEKDPDGAKQRLDEAEKLMKASQQELGLIITELRPAALDGEGLGGALTKYLDTWSQHSHIPPAFQIKNARSLPLPVEQALYRIAQEALANIARHSRATEVQVHLEYGKDIVRLDLIDNGIGFDPLSDDKSGFGLQSMRERAAAIGGWVVIESQKDCGTAIRITIPVNS
jgi:NarL family two-component system sensor histidine kinase LiaS